MIAIAENKILPDFGNFRDRPKLEGCSFFKSIVLFGLHIFVTGLLTTTSAQNRDNYDVLSGLADSLLTEMIDAIPKSVHKVVLSEWGRGSTNVGVIAGSDGSSDDWFIESRLNEVLKDRGFDIYSHRDFPFNEETEDSAAVIDFKLLDIGIGYSHQSIKEGSLKRTARLHFLARIILQPTGKTLYSGGLQGNRQDSVALSERESNENPKVHFTIGRSIETKGGSRILQPIVVTVVTGVVVYLFYALRSR